MSAQTQKGHSVLDNVGRRWTAKVPSLINHQSTKRASQAFSGRMVVRRRVLPHNDFIMRFSI
jgi:hypothetical protein